MQSFHAAHYCLCQSVSVFTESYSIRYCLINCSLILLLGVLVFLSCEKCVQINSALQSLGLCMLQSWSILEGFRVYITLPQKHNILPTH